MGMRRERRSAACRSTLAAAVFVLAGCQTTTTETLSTLPSEHGVSSSILDSRLNSLNKEVKKYPKRHDLHYQIASVHYRKGELKQSAKALEKAIDLSEGTSKYHYHLGRVYLHMGELDQGETQFREACKYMQPGRYTGPHAALGFTLALLKRVDEAIEQFQTCLKIEPENPTFYYFLGSLYDLQGNTDKVIDNYLEYVTRGGKIYRKKALALLEKLGVEVDDTVMMPGIEESIYGSEPGESLDGSQPPVAADE